MIGDFSPGLILILGAVLVPLLRGHLRSAYMLALPVLALMYVLQLSEGVQGQYELFGLELTTLRVDRLSLIFSYIFLLAAFLCVIYALHVRDTIQHVAALVYAGSAVGAVYAGDLVTLFIFWEATSIASVFLIWATRTPEAINSGIRYLVIQVGSGVLLLAAAIVQYQETGSLAFEPMELELANAASVLLFLAFGIKAAFPLLHNWLQDAYPQATVTGTVVLSAFTTKMAIYSLARGFAGTELLIPIGATMTAFPIFYAVIENDLRRVLAYSLNNQLGFMVVGIGIGTELSINGTAAHAFAHILYKALLFMSMGAVLFRTGTIKGSELGGLYKSMPWTTVFCIVGAASISAFPLFSGFVSKGMIITAAMENGYFWTWMVLLFASAGVFHHSGIKIPYFAFFAHDSGKRVKEAPGNMLVAMGITAALCIGIGVFPGPFYEILPFEVEFHAYTLEHVVTQLQLLFFSALAFTVLMRYGIYPPELRSTNLDFDWVYRFAGRRAATGLYRWSRAWRGVATASLGERLAAGVSTLKRHHGPEGVLGGTWPTGVMTFWTTVLLAGLLLAYYI